MLGRIVPTEKGPNEAIPTSAIRPGCSFDFAIWFVASSPGEVSAQAIEFFSCAGDGSCPARWLVAAGLGQSGKAGRDHFYTEIFADWMVRGERANNRGGGFGQAKGLPQSRFRDEPAQAAGHGLPHRR